MIPIGILGGLGPAASSRLYSMLISLCPARHDQDHPDVLLFSKPSVPDRTAYLLGRGPSPLPALVDGLRTLEQSGARLLALPCVTAHHFYNELQAAVHVPLLNMLTLTAKSLAGRGFTRAALLATEGTYASGAFRKALEAYGIAAIVPSQAHVRELMALVYAIKAGEIPAHEQLDAIARPLLQQNAQRIILGCTELSLFAGTRNHYIDPLRILAQEILCNARMYSNI